MAPDRDQIAAGLPVGEVLDAILAQLARRDELVLQAPPGAGKTTVVPLALLQEVWLAGRKIIVLEPRRVAARAAAQRMAALLGEEVGKTVGYRVRLDSQVSSVTRIEVVTEGVLNRMLLDDPALDEVGLLIFDEFHERSLDGDVGLALALQGRELFGDRQPSLKLLLMSATLDGNSLAKLLGGAPQLQCEGRTHPVEEIYAGVYRPDGPIVQEVVELLCRSVLPSVSAPAGQGCSVLVFLPGLREIRRAASLLRESLAGRRYGHCGAIDLVPLHGGLSLAAQQQAISAVRPGRIRVVLATGIAETSLTIPGVDTVVDSGLHREPRYDPRTGVTRLRTVRVSRSAAVQRAGRAGRLRPGRCFRLWSEAQQGQLAEQRVAEILQADLAPMVLQLLAWGESDPAALRWLNPPPAAAFAQALELLASLGALKTAPGGAMCLNQHGEAMSRLPLHPRLAHMVLRGAALGMVELACELAALLAERDPFPELGANIADRHPFLAEQRFNENTVSKAAESAWRQRVRKQARAYRAQAARQPCSAHQPCERPEKNEAPGVLLAFAYPDRIARRRQPGGSIYQLANGRAAMLSESDTLLTSEWLVVCDSGGLAGQAHDRIYSAAPLAAHYLDPRAGGGLLADLVRWREIAFWDEKQGRFVAQRRAMCGALPVASEPLDTVPLDAKRQALLAFLTRQELKPLPWTDALRQWQHRVALLRRCWEGGDDEPNPWPDVSDQALLEGLPQWLGTALDPVHNLRDLEQLDLAGLLSVKLSWPLRRQLDELAPSHWRAPTGTRVRIDYCQQSPSISVRLQEMFGCRCGPVLAQGRVPVVVRLLSPAGRPLQVTADLAGFWAGSYHQVKKEMKGRYPKHAWPDDPLTSQPVRGVRRARSR